MSAQFESVRTGAGSDRAGRPQETAKPPNSRNATPGEKTARRPDSGATARRRYTSMAHPETESNSSSSSWQPQRAESSKTADPCLLKRIGRRQGDIVRAAQHFLSPPAAP